ncbi:MAG: electron transfer flavoprotein subunit beta/FixA family protein [Myxococcales bacterium]|nr:electron transfer flavoprotein subunit beta/FixA family protein [Myxococcales bacterium]
MKILVTVKRVTDYERKVKIAPDGKSLLTDGMSFVANPFDEIAVEEALRLNKAHGGEVVVVSVGPKDSTQEIRKALAMGAHRGILVTAETVDSDVYARALQQLVEKEQPELVIMGKQNTDDDANQEGQLLAGYLNWPQATFASKEAGLDSADEKAQKPGLVVDNGQLTVVREADGGLEHLSVDLPAIVTTDLRLNQPRFASLPGIMKAKKKKVEEFSLGDLGVDPAPKLTYVAYSEPKERQAGQIVENIDALVDRLRNEAKVI